MASNDNIPTKLFRYHSLFLSTGLPLLDATQQLVLDHFTGYSMVIDWQAETIRSATTFTQEKLAIGLALASTWPSFAPYEILMTNEMREGITPSQVDDARSARYLDTVIVPMRAHRGMPREAAYPGPGHSRSRPVWMQACQAEQA